MCRINCQCVDRSQRRDDDDQQRRIELQHRPRPGQVGFQPTFGQDLCDIAHQLAPRNAALAEQYTAAIRYLNPGVFSERGDFIDVAPPEISIPSEDELDDLMITMRCPPPERQAPPAEADEASLDELLQRDWSSLDQDGRQAEIRRFAGEHGVPVADVRWNDLLGPQIQISNVGRSSDRIGLRDLSPGMSNQQIWSIIRAQGGLADVVVDNEVRQSERYQHIIQDEIDRSGFEQMLQVLPQGAPVRSPIGEAAERALSLGSNLTSDRPTGEGILAQARERADLRMSYEIALRRLGRDVPADQVEGR